MEVQSQAEELWDLLKKSMSRISDDKTNLISNKKTYRYIVKLSSSDYLLKAKLINPHLIPLPPSRIIYRTHIFLKDSIKLFFCISLSIKLRSSPDGMQIIPVASLIQLVYSFLLMYQAIQQILISCKSFKERIPLRQPVTLCRIK